MAYGAAWDGNCASGSATPGSCSPSTRPAHAPCTSLGAGTEPRMIDLRDQRCDGTVGGARVAGGRARGHAPGELASVDVTVRDAATGALLATKDVTSGKLDLSGIDAKAHPAIEVEANAISTQGDPAWADAIPPRIRVAWKSDPPQLCFDTTTAVECASPPAPVGVKASVDGSTAKDEKTLDLARGACPPKLGALPDRSVAEETKLDAPVGASDPNGGPLKFSLAKAPPGMSIDGATGRIAWTPSEAQGPGTYDVTLKVADAGGLTDQAAFKVASPRSTGRRCWRPSPTPRSGPVRRSRGARRRPTRTRPPTVSRTRWSTRPPARASTARAARSPGPRCRWARTR